MTTRYESRGGKYWVEVDTTPDEHGLVNYTSSSGGGYTTPEDFVQRLRGGYFQADAKTTPMKEVSRA